jgi:RND family efflux transporter MFP subunit
MRNDLRLLGNTVALHRVMVRAPAAGRLIGLKLNGGDRVQRGETIARVVTREDEAALTGLAVERDLDPATAADAEAAIRRHLDSGGIAVRAPDGGVVSQRFASDGQLVGDLDQIVELIDPSSIYVEAAAPIHNLRAIRVGMPATVTSGVSPGIRFPGRVVALLPNFNPNGVTAPIRIEFSSEARVTQAGAAVEAFVTADYVPDAIVVPTTAIFDDAERNTNYVFVAGDDGRAHRINVDLGIRSQIWVQVVRGLRPGQSVITSGGYALSDGLKIHTDGAGP